MVLGCIRIDQFTIGRGRQCGRVWRSYVSRGVNAGVVGKGYVFGTSSLPAYPCHSTFLDDPAYTPQMWLYVCYSDPLWEDQVRNLYRLNGFCGLGTAGLAQEAEQSLKPGHSSSHRHRTT